MEKHSLSSFDIDESLRRFHADYPQGAKTAIIIMSFDESPFYQKISKQIKNVLKKYNIQALRADDKQYNPNLFLNILTYLHGCSYGISVFERIKTDNQNPNVALEVGYMIALGKDVCLLKEKTLKSLPTDLLSQIYYEFILDDLKSIGPQLGLWHKRTQSTQAAIVQSNQDPLEISSLYRANWTTKNFEQFFDKLRASSFSRGAREFEGYEDDKDIASRAFELMREQSQRLGILSEYISWKKKKGL